MYLQDTKMAKSATPPSPSLECCYTEANIKSYLDTCIYDSCILF